MRTRVISSACSSCRRARRASAHRRCCRKRDKLLEARNMALGIASKNPVLMGVRPEGQEPGPQLQLDIDRLKAQALGINIADLNETLQSVLGVAYINDCLLYTSPSPRDRQKSR